MSEYIRINLHSLRVIGRGIGDDLTVSEFKGIDDEVRTKPIVTVFQIGLAGSPDPAVRTFENLVMPDFFISLFFHSPHNLVTSSFTI